jgi:hypothetical protein
MSRVRYNLEQRVFIWLLCEKNSYKLCRRKFRRKSSDLTFTVGEIKNVIHQLLNGISIWRYIFQIRAHGILIAKKAVKKKSCFNWGITWWDWSSIRKFSSEIGNLCISVSLCSVEHCSSLAQHGIEVSKASPFGLSHHIVNLCIRQSDGRHTCITVYQGVQWQLNTACT